MSDLAERIIRAILSQGLCDWPTSSSSGVIEAAADAVRPLLPVDEPSFDGTGFAHPAYWRGNDAGVDGACRRLVEVLDGKDDGRGVLGGKSLEAVRRRAMAMVAELAVLRDQLRPRNPATEKPPVGVRVLGYLPGTKTQEVVELMDSYRWYNDSWDASVSFDAVSWWMPLPPVPEAKP